MINNNQDLMFWINRNKGKFLGLLFGFIIGLLVLLIGILKTLVILVFALIGLYLGHLLDGGASLQEIIKRLFRK
jgi:uncharacterized membrane protein